MNWTDRTILAWLLGTAVCVAPAWGREASDLPIEITADTAEYNESSRTVTYTGDVAVVQGRATLKSAQLTLYQPKDGPQTLVAEGNPVRFHQPEEEGRKEVRGQSARVEYDLDERLLTLIGDAEIIQSGDRVTSDRIVYDMKTATVTAGAAAQGQERVRTTIQPRN